MRRASDLRRFARLLRAYTAPYWWAVGLLLLANYLAAALAALFPVLMAPILVLVSLLMPKHLDLVFSLIELAVLALATFLFGEITKDGELVWLEGVLLILLYVMMAGTVFVFGS